MDPEKFKPTEQMIHAIEGVKKSITLDPTSYDQNVFINSCGTVLCLAGHLVLNSLPEGPFKSIFRKDCESYGPFAWAETASKILGLPDDYDTTDLFGCVVDWPEPFFTDYETADSPKERAEVGCKRLDYFLETGK